MKPFVSVFQKVARILRGDMKPFVSKVSYHCLHNDSTPMQYFVNFHGCKNSNFQMKNCIIIYKS